MREVEYFQTKAARDERAAQMKQDGYPCRKRSARNQVLSPSAVWDFTGTTSPNGFGGASDKFFSVLYILEY